MRLSAHLLRATTNTNMGNHTSEELQAIKYLGRYQPIRPYPIGNDLALYPARSEMVEYGCSGSSQQTRNNVSYFASQHAISASKLSEKYREWLAFDSFLLNDDSPIRAFDTQKTGYLITVPSTVSENLPITGYFQEDYDNIAGAMFGCAPNIPGLPVIRYSEVYQKYLTLPEKTKELIEWFPSFPTYLSQMYCKERTFFNPNYWRIVHLVVLIEQIVGSPNHCPAPTSTCSCGKQLPRHHAVTRPQWLRQFIKLQISNHEVAQDYVRTIEAGYKVRNKMAHSAYFDRSTHEMPLAQPEIYDIDRATKDFSDDSAALMLLVMSLSDVARNLLLSKVFGINFFMPFRKLTSFPVRNP